MEFGTLASRNQGYVLLPDGVVIPAATERILCFVLALACCVMSLSGQSQSREVSAVVLDKPGPPYCEVPLELSTWDEAKRYYKHIYLPQNRKYWNLWFSDDAKSAPTSKDYVARKYIDIPLDSIKLMVLGLSEPTVEEMRLAHALFIRFGHYVFVDNDTYHMVLSDTVPLVSARLQRELQEDLDFQNAVIDRFIADGYTPENIIRRLWDENGYLNMPRTFLRLLMGSAYCWPLTAIVRVAAMRLMQSDEYRTALANYSVAGFLDLGASVDSKNFAAKLNMSEGMLYAVLRDNFMHWVCDYVTTRNGKIVGREPGPNVLRSAHVFSSTQQELCYTLPVRYKADKGMITWIGETADWQDLKPPVDPGDF